MILFLSLLFSILSLQCRGIYLTICMEKAMAPHSSTLAWKIPWMEESGRLQSMGSLRVGHDWATSLSLFSFMHWRRKWQPTPVFLPGDSQGWAAWWAAVYGVSQSQTWLKQLSSSSSSMVKLFLKMVPRNWQDISTILGIFLIVFVVSQASLILHSCFSCLSCVSISDLLGCCGLLSFMNFEKFYIIIFSETFYVFISGCAESSLLCVDFL